MKAFKIITFVPCFCLSVTAIVAFIRPLIESAIAISWFALAVFIVSLVPLLIKKLKLGMYMTYEVVKTVLFFVVGFGYVYVISMVGSSSLDLTGFGIIIYMLVASVAIAIAGLIAQVIIYKKITPKDKEDDNPTKFVPFG